MEHGAFQEKPQRFLITEPEKRHPFQALTLRTSTRTAEPAGQLRRARDQTLASRGHRTEPTGIRLSHKARWRDAAPRGGVRHPTKFKNGLRTV